MKTAAKKGTTKATQTSSSAPEDAPKPAVKPARNVTKKSLEDQVQSALKWLKSHSTKSTLDGMARYAIPSDKPFGVAYRGI
jgi:hypothetical protein